jgi:hypothetical protein
MPDLTDAELEAMERRADNGNQQRIDIYALIAALREARRERDEWIDRDYEDSMRKETAYLRIAELETERDTHAQALEGIEQP